MGINQEDQNFVSTNMGRCDHLIFFAGSARLQVCANHTHIKILFSRYATKTSSQDYLCAFLFGGNLLCKGPGIANPTSFFEGDCDPTSTIATQPRTWWNSIRWAPIDVERLCMPPGAQGHMLIIYIYIYDKHTVNYILIQKHINIYIYAHHHYIYILSIYICNHLFIIKPYRTG